MQSPDTVAGRLTTAPFDVADINHLVLAGWAGRNHAAVEAHIRELEALGTPRPTRTPVFYAFRHLCSPPPIPLKS